MVKKLFVLFSYLLFVAVIQAAPVDRSDAQKKAQQFLAGKQAAARGTSQTSSALSLAMEETSCYYVFNVGTHDGFVIVSGDDRAPEILGYSDTGSFDANNVPTNMRAFLQGYADEIKHMPAVAASRGVGQRRTVRNSISPLLTTLWDQGAPYNNNCPEIASGSKAVTGCVATAMAQVMNYHHFPTAATFAIPGYTPKNSRGQNVTPVMSALSSTTFDWAKMYNSYDNGEDGAEVAKLMLYCGCSVNMWYGLGSTGGSQAATELVPNALKTYFGYDNGARYVKRSSYSYLDWISLLYTELAERRPVLMGGQSTGGGHAFVCDGYDEEDFFHINWGWGGNSNGYFRLSNLTPDMQGAGASSTSDGYNLGLDACIGIQPNIGTPPEVELLTVRNMKFYGTDEATINYTRNSYDEYFHDSNSYPVLTCEFWNFTVSNKAYDYGLRLKKDGEKKQDYIWGNNSSINSNSASIPGRSVEFGAGLEDGIYQFVAICKPSGSEVWTECIDADKYYIEAVITGNTIKMNVVKPTVYHLKANSVTGVETLVVGQTQTLTVNIENNGEGDYHGDITLAFTWEENESTYISYLGGKTIEISAANNKDVAISVTPRISGAFILNIYDGLFDNGTLLGTVGTNENPVVVSSSTPPTPPTGTDNVELSFTTSYNSVIDETDNNKKCILGGKLKATVTAINNTDNNYNGGCTLILYKWEGNNASGNYYLENLFVPAHSSTDIVFEYDVDIDAKYSMVVEYQYETNYKAFNESSTIYDYYYPKKVVKYIAADDTETYGLAKSTYVVPANALTVDLRGQSIVETVTPNANPNCLYLLDNEASVTGITSNIIKGTTAEQLSLADGSDFCAPFNFTAETVNYTRTFTIGTNGEGAGWTTIILPFDVDKVEVYGVEKKWFTSDDDTGKHFWVKKFVADASGQVSFDYTDKIEANTPYIIAVPDNTWGDAWDLRGKPMVFSGTNKLVTSDKAVSSGNHYNFVGTTKSVVLTGVYALDEAGQYFDYGNTTVHPFRAYFKGSSLATVGSSLRITDNLPTAIGDIYNVGQKTSQRVYSLDGRDLGNDLNCLPKGVYVVNGKKVIK